MFEQLDLASSILGCRRPSRHYVGSPSTFYQPVQFYVVILPGDAVKMGG